MLDINVRPIKDSDVEQLEKWRQEFKNGSLEVPHGYEHYNVETAVAVKGDRILGALTGTIIVSLDPYIRNPEAGTAESLQSLFALCRSLEYRAKKQMGCVESYIAVPNSLEEYKGIVKRCGFEETAQNCAIFRHVLG